mgnify:CR=1 FL=1
MSGTCDSGHVFILSRLSHSPYVAHCRSARAPLLAQTIAFALRADVISEHGSEYEVLLRSKLVERTVHHPPYGMNALPLSEEQVHFLLSTGCTMKSMFCLRRRLTAASSYFRFTVKSTICLTPFFSSYI